MVAGDDSGRVTVYEYPFISGPQTWVKDYPVAEGQSQSPVNIETTHAMYDPGLTSNLLTTKYDLERELELINTGHSISVKINQDSGKCLCH